MFTLLSAKPAIPVPKTQGHRAPYRRNINMDVYGELIFNQNQHNELERLNHITTAFDSITKEHITQLNLP